MKSLVTHDNGNTFSVINQYLDKLRNAYAIGHRILQAKDYDGHLQSRPRIYIVGIRWEIFHPKVTDTVDRISIANTIFPLPTNRRTPLDSIWVSAPSEMARPLTPHKKRLLKRLVDSGCRLEENYIVNLNISGGVKFPVHAMKDKCPCLLAYASPYYLTAKKRCMVPREALRIQGFPDSFKQVVSNNQMMQQVGNSMSIGVLVHLIRNIFQIVSA